MVAVKIAYIINSVTSTS